MLKVRRTLYIQLAAFTAAIGLLLVLSRFFPIADLIAAAQKRVDDLGAWSVLCYPLLFAACNLLLLPGGLVSVGAGFFFGLWWGFFIVLLGNSIGAALSLRQHFCFFCLAELRCEQSKVRRKPEAPTKERGIAMGPLDRLFIVSDL